MQINFSEFTSKPLNSRSVASKDFTKVINLINSLITLLLLKSDSHPLKYCLICFTESPLKKMKNDFYFILKALFNLKLFKFLSSLFVHVGKTP